MKIIILVAGARAGLEFFQSLLDGHKEVLQLPGTIHFNKSLIKLLSIKSKKKLEANRQIFNILDHELKDYIHSIQLLIN
mgnify:CR=1 FL=1